MHLKKIELRGFKSFADKTEIEFKGGVTAIVGPNGSGKSNISDAVRWVLGEQSAKTLRGSKMEDIIFAGAAERKPLGMAEVSLTLDNQSNKLDINYSEVTVTRRVYRSGDSEYYINKSLCRLKDIKEIFMDTGVGIDGYSIIGQGKIDEILSNKSGDRRLLFEEAVGIVKYRSRKEESEKKLKNTGENLTRVDDIIGELEGRIPSLEKQSNKAKTFAKLKEELKGLEINVYINEFENVCGNLDSLLQQQKIVNEQLQYNTDKRNEINKEFYALKEKIQRIDELTNSLKNNLFEMSNNIEKKEGQIKVSNEKVINIKNNLKRLSNEIADLKVNQSNLLKDIGEAQKHLSENKGILEKEGQNIDSKRTRFDNLVKDILTCEENLELFKNDLIEILNVIATRKSEINSLESLKGNFHKRREIVKNEKVELEKLREGMLVSLNEIKNQKNLLEDNFCKLDTKKNKYINELKILEEKRNTLKENEEASVQKSREFKTKRNLLVEMQNAYEGFSKGVKETLRFCKNNPIGQGVRGVVGELISVPKGLEVAIEVTLGATMQNIICNEAKDAREIISELKKRKLGRVTFLPIENFEDNYNKKKDHLELSDNVLGYASELVEFSPMYEGVMKFLLGRTIIVDTLDTGIKLSKKLGKKYKVVSIEGDLVNTTGAITGGSYKSKTLNILSRKREIEELEKNLENEDKYIKKILADKDVLMKEIATLEKKIIDNEKNIKSNEIDKIKVSNEIEKSNYELKNGETQIKKLQREMQQIEVEVKNTDEEVERKNKEVKELSFKEQRINNDSIESKKQYEKLKFEKESLNEVITDFKMKMATLEEKEKNYKREIEESNRELAKLQNTINLKESDVINMEKDSEKEESLLKNMELEIKENYILKSQYEINLQKENDNKEEISKVYNQLEVDIRKSQDVISQLHDSNHKVDLRIARLEVQQQNALNKLTQEYDLTYEEAKEFKNEEINISEASKVVKQLRGKIKALGNVNMDSIEEYDTVMNRFEFLSGQRDDLINSIKSLKDVIKNMESTMEKQFIEVLEKIKINFNDIFKSLFGGGKAEIVLADKDDILNSKIEIIAQPPGKKLQNLSLLSGGEKALTAISLLFAILKVKPSPFCILDEIEAALDEANVYRYAEFLKEFSKDTQFIVVTHRKGTMESVDALYGVTMEKQGVSRLVSIEMNEKVS